MGAIDDSGESLPVAYVIFRDPYFDGASNIVSATSQGGASFGLVEPSTSNRGQTYAYQEGTPTGTTEVTLRGQGGAPGLAGAYVHRLSTEGSASDWKAMNALTVPVKNKPVQTGTAMHAHAVVYSRAYDRLLVFNLTSATNVNVYYTGADGHLSSPTTTTITVADANTSTPSGGLDAEELPDGTLLLAVQVLRRLDDVDLYMSTDGGTSWSLSQRGIGQREAAGIGYSASVGQMVMRRSGDWMRILALTSTGLALTTVTGYTMVSPDRGASWRNIGGVLVNHWPASVVNYFVGSAPFDIIGLDDVAGTFLLAQTNQASSKVTIYVAQGTDSWTLLSDLDFTYSTYATSAKCKGLWWARGMDRLWLWMWIEGSDASEIVCRVVDVANPFDSGNWRTLGTMSAFGGVLRYGPHRPHAVFAGNRFYWSAGIQDATVAGGADAVVAGHWTMMLGGMDPYPLAPSNYSNGWYLSAFAASFKLLSYNWQGPLGDPVASAITPYTQITGSATTTWNKDRMTLSATTAIGINYYLLSLSPGSASEAWGDSTNRGFTFCVRLKVTAERSTSADDCGFRIVAPSTYTATTTGYDVSIRCQLNAIEVYNNVSTAVLATISTTDAASDVEIRATICGTSLWLKRRLVSAGATGVWTLSGPYTLTSGTIAGQRFRVGVIGIAGGTAGTSTIEVYEWSIGKGSDTLSQRGDLTKPDDMFGTMMTADPVLVAGGAWVGWAGPGSVAGDTYTAAIEYNYGIANLSVSCPRYYWESTSLAENAMVFEAADGGVARWQMNAILLVGTTDLSVTLQLHASNSWGSPSVSVTLSAVLWSNLKVASVEGNQIQLTTVSGTFEARPGQLVGQYLRATSGTASGQTYRIVADQDVAGSRWVAIDATATAAAEGFATDDTISIFTDRMAYLSDTMWRYRYFRLVFPDVSSVGSSRGTATGTHRLGALVPGHAVKLERQDGLLDVRFNDAEEYPYSRARSRSGVDHRVKEGPAARSMTLTLSNALDPEDPNGPRGELPRQMRDLIREVQDGGTLPVGLVVDSLTMPDRQVVLYGTLGLDGARLEHPHSTAVKGTDGRYQFPSSIDLNFEEET